MNGIKSGSALIVRLRGGLGNQLFQYAAGRSLAARSGVPLLLDTKRGFEADPYGRSYALDAFRLSRAVSEIDSESLGLAAEARRCILHRFEILRLKFAGTYFSPFIQRVRISRPTVLDAYCQSPRYFSDIEGTLRDELTFKAIPDGLNNAIADEIQVTNSVCIHARRLLGVPANAEKAKASIVNYYGACDVGYYRNALHSLLCEHGTLTAYLFSDSIGWARENAHLLAVKGCSVKIVDEPDTLKSFYLMRLCKHFVLANSTFGWWAAWLGGFARKTVCIPSAWNRGEKRFPSELFPEGWRIVPAA